MVEHSLLHLLQGMASTLKSEMVFHFYGKISSSIEDVADDDLKLKLCKVCTLF